MNYTRTFFEYSFEDKKVISLNKKDFHHEINVLRKKEGDKFVLFDGKGSSCLAEVTELKKRTFEIKIIRTFPEIPRFGIEIDLGQALIKNSPFFFSVQKATELGVSKFSPLLTERVSVKRHDYSQLIEKSYQTAKGACEQCGENWLPEITFPQSVLDWCEQCQD
ncbi:MAG: RsmE family RNA methyltransferase, partial [Pseudomonadota bacterium]|nr:RsmE family RNA methyltransferase [Pseudomonadota bacterium]